MIVKLPEELTLSHVAEIRKSLLDALATKESIQLQVAEVTQVDAAGLQLLCALHRSSNEKKVELTILDRREGDVLGVAAKVGGFWRHKGCEKGCLWEVK